MNQRTARCAIVCLGLSVIAALQSGIASAQAAPATEGDELREIAQEAYIYLYSLVTMDVSRKQFTNVEPGAELGRGPMNSFVNVREYPPANFRAIVRPNFDTLYSIVWLDLTAGPMVVTAPNTDGRYYMLPMLDMWTDVFAVPGKRTTGTGEGHFAVTPPGWHGELPEGVQQIKAPTPYVWVIGRTQTNGPADYAAVHKVQDGYKATPLARWGQAPTPPAAVKIDPSVDMKTPPLRQVNAMPADKYFTYAAELMKLHPPHITDQPIVARMKRLGIVAGQSFDAAKASPEVQAALQQGAADGLATMERKMSSLAAVVNGWQMNTTTMGVYGTYYLKRAILAMVGLGANLPEDAIYPMLEGDADGKPLTGDKKYVVHFPKGETPPVDAFWSITMYDAEGFQTANPINRFAIGDRDALKFNGDGSLDIYMQHDNPGGEKESNWLPSPASGELGVTMRLYAPRAAALEGTWSPPAVKRVE